MSSNTTLLTSGARLIVTTHNASGKSTFHSDLTLPSFSPFGPSGSSFTIFDTRSSVPVNNLQEPTHLRDTIPRVPASGVNFCVTNIAPRFSVPMHRTLSLDYAVVLAGEIVLALDSREERMVKAGEFIVQQGVNHAWHNRTDEVCRIAFVGVGAEMVVLGSGEELRETVIKVPAK
ncbi:uncharacterized protein GGS22DRAFT_62941 [Annulohypoxylon maeteangense]|uniref:uncharacterized protein n=1 Tax=Annulohypoxylon maeteangense TaxID=1927788 RepID=UPI0020080776|nr:uncharacterized protein GGS22DRAFT_62941 [Annulohypoxylon maeteangense]KAI0888770.1 hypothetical protein GGS22DRAFT_62941 [Annulohypoxylon maeteangense]